MNTSEPDKTNKEREKKPREGTRNRNPLDGKLRSPLLTPNWSHNADTNGLVG